QAMAQPHHRATDSDPVPAATGLAGTTADLAVAPDPWRGHSSGCCPADACRGAVPVVADELHRWAGHGAGGGHYPGTTGHRAAGAVAATHGGGADHSAGTGHYPP